MKKEDHHESHVQGIIRFTNNRPLSVRVLLEPWSDIREVASGATVRISADGPPGFDLEVEARANELVFYGWTGSILDFQDDKP